MVFRCWFISGLFPFPNHPFGLWPDNLSRGLVKPCRWVWKAGCKGSFDVFCSYHSLHGWLCRAEILSCVHWTYLESTKPLANIWPFRHTSYPILLFGREVSLEYTLTTIYRYIQIRPPIYCDKNSQLFPFRKDQLHSGWNQVAYTKSSVRVKRSSSLVVGHPFPPSWCSPNTPKQRQRRQGVVRERFKAFDSKAPDLKQIRQELPSLYNGVLMNGGSCWVEFGVFLRLLQSGANVECQCKLEMSGRWDLVKHRTRLLAMTVISVGCKRFVSWIDGHFHPRSHVTHFFGSIDISCFNKKGVGFSLIQPISLGNWLRLLRQRCTPAVQWSWLWSKARGVATGPR